MTVPTASETSLLRSRPHNTKLWLSIYQPDYRLHAQVTGTVTKGDRVIPLCNVSGTYSNVGYGQTLYVGTTFAGSDKGKVRSKWGNSIGGNISIEVAENSHINWQVGDYISVADFYEIWPVYPRIVLVTGTTTTTWYKDYDINYTNQNSVLGYLICMGPHHAGFLDAGQHQIYYTAQGTQHVRADETGTAYYWDFEGGTPNTYEGITPGYVTYNAAGHYTTRLIVSGSVTQSGDWSYRHISIYDRPEKGINLPISKWQLLDLSGSRDQGGYTASIRVFENIPETTLRDGSLVVIFSDDRYGTTDQSIGGNAINRQKIVFVGYIIDGTIKYNYKDSYVDFDLASPTEIMKACEGFSVSVQDSDDPANDAATNPDIPSGWVALLDMDTKKALYHYLRWHSTVGNCCDIQYIGTNQKIQYFDADRTSIYDAINTLISSAVVGGIVSDRQGKIYVETDIFVTTGTFNTGLSISKQDWMGDPSIEERPVNEVSYLEMGGIAYDGTTFSALMSAAPGATPAYRGKVERQQGLALTDQTQLNLLTGQLYAQKNAKYPNIELHLAGNYRNFDIAPQEIVPLTISPSDTIRGIVFAEKSFFINNMSWQYDATNETFLPAVGLEEIASGIAGDSIEIPDVPPIESDSGGGFTIPPIIIPPFEIPPFPTFDVGINRLFAPALYAQDESLGLEAVRLPGTTDYQYQFVNTDQTVANSIIVFPTGATSVNLYPIFRNASATTGNIQITMSAIVYNTLGLAVFSNDIYSGYIPIVASKVNILGPGSVVGAAGYIVSIKVSRDATDPGDTYNSGNLAYMGIVAEFA